MCTRLNSCTCHIFLCVKMCIWIFFVLLFDLVWCLFLNDISCDMHGSSSIASAYTSACRYYRYYYCNISTQCTCDSILFFHLSSAAVIDAVALCNGMEISHTTMLIIYSQLSRSLVHTWEQYKNKEFIVCVSVCTSSAPRNEFYRFSSGYKSRFSWACAQAFVYQTHMRWRKTEKNEKKTATAQTKIYFGMFRIGFLRLCR